MVFEQFRIWRLLIISSETIVSPISVELMIVLLDTVELMNVESSPMLEFVTVELVVVVLVIFAPNSLEFSTRLRVMSEFAALVLVMFDQKAVLLAAPEWTITLRLIVTPVRLELLMVDALPLTDTRLELMTVKFACDPP